MVKIYKENKLYSYDEDNYFHVKQINEGGRSNPKLKQSHLDKTKKLLKMSASMIDLHKNDKEVVRYASDLANPYFAEPIFKCGCKLYTGYFTDNASQWLYNEKDWRPKSTTEKLGEPRDGYTEEHWIPRTTVGKIIVDGLFFKSDNYNVFNTNNISLDMVHNWIDENTHLFCSLIIASVDENDKLKTEIDKNHYTFSQLLNLEHYKSNGITLHKNTHFLFEGYCAANGSRKTNIFGKTVGEQKQNIQWRHQKWDFPTSDDSHFYPNIITPAMQELCVNKGLTNVH
tara:strand:- start:328 stop:1182 length:855 start_codon:yes stop_codon:yes gene_type:complete